MAKFFLCESLVLLFSVISFEGREQEKTVCDGIGRGLSFHYPENINRYQAVNKHRCRNSKDTEKGFLKQTFQYF